jgi:hypothetical protein
MPERDERMMPVSAIASVALHALIAVPVVFDIDLFGSRFEEPVLAFAVGMVPLSEVTAAPQVGEITPPRPLERLELPAGNEAAEVDRIDPDAPERAPTATPSPESRSEPPPPAEELPTETPPPQVASAEAPPPVLTEAPEPPAAATPEEPQPAPPPSLADPELVQAPNAPAPDAPQVAALDAPTLPTEQPQPEERPAPPAMPAPPLPPERAQARVRTDPDPAEDEEDDEEPPVQAETPPAPEQAPPETQLAVLEPPPAPSFAPRRDRAPEPPTPQTPVVDNTAPPPERTSAIDSVLASMQQQTTAPVSGQGTGSDTGSGGRSGTGTAQSGARLAGDRLTLSEEEALRAQLARCWNIPAGAMDAQNLQVTIRAVINPDRTVASAEIVDNGRLGDSFYRAAADAARRALFLCSPLALPPDKYEQWQQITFNFDPRDMF